MNKPAPKEPSMDEILSSIRQIIADDDAAAAPKRPSPPVQPLASGRPAPVIPASSLPPAPPRVVPAAIEPAASKPLAWDAALETDDDEDEGDDSPLALSAEQIVQDEDEESEDAAAEVSFESIVNDLASEASALSNAGLVYPDDIAFAPEGVPEAAPSLKPEPEPSRQRQPILPPKFEPRAQPMARPAPSPVPPYVPLRPSPTAAQAAAMPDPMLSTDIAAQLIEPATDAAVRNTFSKLNKLGFPPANTLGVGGPGLTIEAMVREMLRPMLKEWLDDNLPAVVERMVEKEIGRISRGA